MGFRLTFNFFEIEVLKHLVIAPLQLHPSSWVYMRLYQYWCKYVNGRPSVFLFLHLFKFLYDSASKIRGRRLLCLKPATYRFESLLEFPPFEDHFFLVTPVNPEAHAAIFYVNNIVEHKCANLFSNWIEGHFLLGNNFVIYIEKDLSKDA